MVQGQSLTSILSSRVGSVAESSEYRTYMSSNSIFNCGVDVARFKCIVSVRINVINVKKQIMRFRVILRSLLHIWKGSITRNSNYIANSIPIR